MRANILERITARHRVSAEELEQFFDRDRRSFGQVQETKTGIEIVNSLDKVLVLGKPGSGKTTFLKYITLQALDGKLDKKLIPVFISLKDWSDSGQPLFDFIVEQFDICGFPEAGPFVERVLENGKCLLLLDGFDEVASLNVDQAIQEIRNFSDKYSQNQFVTSCRIAAYDYVFERFTEVEMADFNDEQIKTFIDNWFGEDESTAALCWDRMNNSVSVKELASIPLLLTMLCLAFDEALDFPANRAELYEEAVDALLRKWDSSRRVKRDYVYRQLSSRRKESMLSQIAAKCLERDQYFIPQRVLEQHIADFIKHLPDATEGTLKPDSEDILKAVEVQHGLFVERARNIYSFSHLTVQEYFTAK